MVGKIQAFGCLVVVAVNKETLENISFLLLTTRSQEAREGRKREWLTKRQSLERNKNSALRFLLYFMPFSKYHIFLKYRQPSYLLLSSPTCWPSFWRILKAWWNKISFQGNLDAVSLPSLFSVHVVQWSYHVLVSHQLARTAYENHQFTVSH